MTGLLLAALVIAAGVVATVWLKHAGERCWVEHQLQAQQRIHVDLVFDAGPFLAQMSRVVEAGQRLAASLQTRRPCGCPEMCEHTRDCPDHPANRGWQSHLRWRSRQAAARWHRWWRLHAIASADRHFDAERTGRWFR